MDNHNLRMRLMLEAEKEIVEGLTEAERYRYFLGRMQFLKYESGKENLTSFDCSGSVCLALLLSTGCAIRVTADSLYRKYFTKKNPDKNDIQAAFFITLYDRKLGSRVYKENEVCHVAGICGKDVVLNCVEPYAVLRSISDMRPVYNAMDYTVVVRGLDRKALQKASDERSDLFGADYEFLEFEKAISEDKG
jgi:murein DD-endopeptidase